MREFVAVGEGPQPGMLEEPADDRLDVNILAQALNTGSQAADAADDEVDRDAGAARFVELVDDRGINERIHLCPDAGWLARVCVGDFDVD